MFVLVWETATGGAACNGDVCVDVGQVAAAAAAARSRRRRTRGGVLHSRIF